ncbi:uncharacterized protein YbcI [Pullulanibacillus pueri]|nr:uncharacterized protein YbcI [Pullulanibacillus pueri]
MDKTLKNLKQMIDFRKASIMVNKNTLLHTKIASYIGRTLRDHFGKGPESVYVSLGHSIITIYLKNFMTPMERILLDQQQETTVLEMRSILMENLIPEIRAHIKVSTSMDIKEFYYDWNLENRTGMLVGIFKEHEVQSNEAYSKKELLHQKIMEFTHKVHRRPQEIESFLINSRTLIIIKKGVLIELERELIKMGFKKVLLNAKKKITKNVHDRSVTFFENLLEREISEIFIDWNFEEDKDIAVLILKPKLIDTQ